MFEPFIYVYISQTYRKDYVENDEDVFAHDPASIRNDVNLKAGFCRLLHCCETQRTNNIYIYKKKKEN